MALFGFLGSPGKGKTMLITWFIKNLQETGLYLWCNYHLINIPYEYIKSILQLKKITPDKKKVFVFDEAWIQADSRRSSSYDNIEFSNFLLQCRKLGGDVLYSAQDKGQADKRFGVTNTEMFIYPEIVATETVVINGEEKRLPLVIKAVFTNNLDYILGSAYFNVEGMYKFYDTNEKIEKARIIDYGFLIKKYNEFEGKETQLASIISAPKPYGEDLPKSDGLQFARYFIAYKAGHVKPILT